MGAVHIGVRHDDDAVVAQLVGVELFLADAATQRRHDRADFGRAQHLVEARLLHVEDLALQRQDRLVLAVASLLRRAARGISLHEVQLRQGRVLFLAIRELAGQPGDVQRALAPCHLPRLARRFPRPGGVEHLADDRLRLARVFQQVFGEPRRHGLFHRGFHLRGNQLVLGLGGELRIGHLHRDDGREALAGIISRGVDLGLARQALLLDVVVQAAGQGSPEARQVSAAIALRDVVGVAENVFLEAVVPLQRDFHADFVVSSNLEVKRLIHRCLVLVEVVDERAKAAIVLIYFIFSAALILEDNADAGVEEGQLAQPLRQVIKMELDVGEGFAGGPEAHGRTGGLRRTDLRQRRIGHPVAVSLFVHLALAPDSEHEFLRERIHHGHTDAVQATGHLVGVVVKLPARMEDRHDHLRRRDTFFVHFGRDTPAVVTDGH